MPSGTGARLHKTLPDVSTPHVLGELEPKIASEAEVDSKIETHRGNPSAHHAIDDVIVISQTTEPIVPAGKTVIWHDTTIGAERWWKIVGTDGTLAGNKKVEVS